MAESAPRRAPAMPKDVDEKTPNAARMYDYFLGGEHNFAADRELGQQIAKAFPVVHRSAMLNRTWMRRVVIDSLNAGIRQFLDIGSGVPTMGNVHEIVRENLPRGERASVVYVDYESVAVHHSRNVLAQDDAEDWAAIVQHDLRDPDAIFDDLATRRLIDFSQPVSLMMIFILHFIGPDDHPERLMDIYRSRMASGSRLSISHGTIDGVERSGTPQAAQAESLYRNTSNPVWGRGRDEIMSWFGDWNLLYYPDLVHLPDWRPEPGIELTAEDLAARPYIWCGAAEKP